MKKNIIKKLAEQSYTKNNLDHDKIANIARRLKREDLKIYIKDLKILESKNTVTITLPGGEGIKEINPPRTIEKNAIENKNQYFFPKDNNLVNVLIG